MTHHDHNHNHGHHHGDHHHKHHDHDHEHDHGHHHHHHDHDQHQEPISSMSDREKLVRLLDHWVAHNNDHADNYLQWSGKAEKMGLEDVARLLKEAVDLTHAISDKFIKAKDSL